MLENSRQLTGYFIKGISLDKLTLKESNKYLKRLKINKFGLPKFKEMQNLI